MNCSVGSLRNTGPVALSPDGHKSHSSLPLIEEAHMKASMYSFHIEHNCSSLLMLEFCGSLKQVCSEVVKELQPKSMGVKVDMESFPSLVTKSGIMHSNHITSLEDSEQQVPPSVMGGHPRRNIHAFSSELRTS